MVLARNASPTPPARPNKSARARLSLTRGRIGALGGRAASSLRMLLTLRSWLRSASFWRLSTSWYRARLLSRSRLSRLYSISFLLSSRASALMSLMAALRRFGLEGSPVVSIQTPEDLADLRVEVSRDALELLAHGDELGVLRGVAESQLGFLLLELRIGGLELLYEGARDDLAQGVADQALFMLSANSIAATLEGQSLGVGPGEASVQL